MQLLLSKMPIVFIVWFENARECVCLDGLDCSLSKLAVNSTF